MKLGKNMICVFIVRPRGDTHDFLMLQRAGDDSLRGSWHTVYGGIRKKEQAHQAALRELREETGLTPLEFFRLGVASTFYLHDDDKTWIVPCFCAVVATDAAVVLNDENHAFRWISRETAGGSFMWPTDRAAVDHLCRDILDNGPCKPYLRLPL